MVRIERRRWVGRSGSRMVVGVEVRGRGARELRRGGCIDCVRLVRGEEVRRDREGNYRGARCR